MKLDPDTPATVWNVIIAWERSGMAAGSVDLTSIDPARFIELRQDMEQLRRAYSGRQIPVRGRTSSETRTWSCLRSAGFLTFDEAALASREDLSRVPNFGAGALKTLVAKLNEFGIKHHLSEGA